VTRADGRSAAERLVALFEALEERVRPEICRGCPFSMAVTEFPDETLEGHRSAVRLKRWVRARIRELTREVCASRSDRGEAPAVLADHLTLLFEGVYATVPTLGAAGPAKRAREIAALLLRVPASGSSDLEPPAVHR
jgi:hypothetical protein